MSQSGFFDDTTLAADVETLSGDTGGAVSPNALHNIDILGGPGIDVDGTPGSNLLTISLNGGVEGTGTTVGAVTDDLITLSLGGTAGTYLIETNVVGFESTTPAGAVYRARGAFRTTGAASTEIGTDSLVQFEDVALAGCSVDAIANANNVIIRVTGTAGLTCQWRAFLTFTFVS